MQADGFVMSGEHVPLWRRLWPGAGQRTFGHLRRSHVEAAARLALWEDFDCKSIDALCVSLLGEEIHFSAASQSNLADLHVVDPAGVSERFPLAAESHRLLCDWLLSISEELLNPRLEQAQETSQARPEVTLDMSWRGMGRAGSTGTLSWRRRISGSQQRASAELARSSGQHQRFAYFVDKVRPLQVWRDDGGALFLQLKGIAQGLMDGVARACDERYAVLVAEPCGRELAAFCSIYVEPTKVQQLLSGASSLEDRCTRSGRGEIFLLLSA